VKANSGYTEANTPLVERCKKGDNAAFKEIYSLYVKAMLNVSMRIVNNKDEAEDVLQESFLAAFRNIQKYDAKGSFGNWLKRIVINNSIDFIKKKKVHFVPIENMDYAEEELMEEAEMTYEVETIKNAIAQLPDGFRIILSLYLFEDYSHRMIAEKLNISEGTSRSQYARARKKLVKIIQQKDMSYERQS
jgi:RNA polymerase sigma factor (sigma-70 family)